MFEAKVEIDQIVNWLRDNVEKAGAKGVVFGLSGGIDSAVVAGLAKKAFPNDSLGIIMPIHSNIQDEIDARKVSELFDLNTSKVDLSVVYDTFIRNLPFEGDNKMASANLKPRLRMMTLYYYAQEMGYLVCGTSNKSEWHVGYFTKYGDSGVDLLPIISFVKGEVREIAKELQVPFEVIEKHPTAGLWEGQTDEKEMGFTYEVLDNFINTGEGPEYLVRKIQKMNNKSSHKRQFPVSYEKK